MSESSHDTRISVVNATSLEGFDTDTEGDEDIHVCKKCRIVFKSLEEYLQHKVKHDNYRVTFSRSGHDRRMVVPKLVPKTTDTAKEDEVVQPGKERGEKESTGPQKRKRGRKKKTKVDEEVNQEFVIKDMPAYYCPKCDLKFNREATLRRHTEYVHDMAGDYTRLVGEEDGEEAEASTGHVVPPDESDEEDTEDPDYKRVKANPPPMETSERRFECHICQNRFKEINVLKMHLLTHSNKREFTCTMDGCFFAFKTKGSLKRHMRRHTGERPYSCAECGRTFTESGALTRHMKSRIPCINKSDQDLPRYGKRWSFVPNNGAVITIAPDEALEEGELLPSEVSTDEAGEVLVQEVDIATFEVIHLSDKDAAMLETEEDITSTQCRVCKADCYTIDALRTHLKTHLADMPFRCGLCHFVAEKRELLSSHMLYMHRSQLKGLEQAEAVIPISDWNEDSQDKEKQSVDAKTAVKQMLRLATEINSGSEEVSDTDLVRNAKTAVEQMLQLATELSSGSEEVSHTDLVKTLYRCLVCNKTFRANSNLRLHMKSHTGERPHKCPHCDKCFVTKDTLCKHLSVHSEERQYKCGECGKLFKRISHVREHLKIHSSDRPFPCTSCEKSFKTCNAMRVHIRTHTDVMPYVCPYCRRNFREKGSLSRHVRMHTGEKPFNCRHCGKSFSEHGTLNRHLKAKVPCTRQLQIDREDPEELETTYPTVLAEFSSVADTQQYIATQDSEQDTQEESQTEYVVLQTDLRDEDLHNVEIITEGEVDTTMLEGMQVNDDYIVVTDGDQGMKILDSKTGETIAMMPLSSLSDRDGQLITMATDNEIEAVAMVPNTSLDISDSIVEQAMMVANVEEQVEITETALQDIVDDSIQHTVTEEMIITSETASDVIESVN